MRTLPTQPLKEAQYAEVRARIQGVILDLVFAPVFLVLSPVSKQMAESEKEFENTLDNSPKVLLTALRSGAVQYKEGVFTGKFNKGLSEALRKIGAVFYKNAGDYRMAPGSVPADVRAAGVVYQDRAETAHKEVIKVLSDIVPEIDEFVESQNFETVGTAEDLQAEFIKKAAEKIQLLPELGKEFEEALTEQYTENLKLSIKNFAAREIMTLRQEVSDNAKEGYRFDRLAELIKQQHRVSDSKAEFIARQETALFMSAFREQHFRGAGVTRYIWRTAMDQRVRDSHQHLEGKVFFYSEPPIVDPATGRRRNPGQDYGCRCVDEPIIDELGPGEDF